MDVNPISAATMDALVAVSIKCLSAALFPFANVWRSLSAAPMMASFSLVRTRYSLRAASRAARNPAIRPCHMERNPADRAGSSLPAAPAPTPLAVTRKRTIYGRPLSQIVRRSVEWLCTYGAMARLTILFPIECFSRLPLVPCRSNDVALAAIWRTVDAGAVSASNRCAAPFARMWVRFHLVIITHYAAMAERRIRGDAGMFAAVETG